MSMLIVPPVTPQAVSLSHVWPGRTTWESPGKLIRTVLDADEFDFHMDVAPDVSPSMVKGCVAKLWDMGLEPLDDDECEPEVLDDGFVRIYFTPVDPVSDTAIDFIGIDFDSTDDPRDQQPLPRIVGEIEEAAGEAVKPNKGGSTKGATTFGLGVFAAIGLAPKQGLLALLAVA